MQCSDHTCTQSIQTHHTFRLQAFWQIWCCLVMPEGKARARTIITTQYENQLSPKHIGFHHQLSWVAFIAQKKKGSLWASLLVH